MERTCRISEAMKSDKFRALRIKLCRRSKHIFNVLASKFYTAPYHQNSTTHLFAQSQYLRIDLDSHLKLGFLLGRHKFVFFNILSFPHVSPFAILIG